VSLGFENGASDDQVYDALGADRRRAVLAVLAREGALEARELAAAVAEAEGGRDGEVDDVHRSLHHVHLPKLDDAGLVAYDHEDGFVVPTATADDVPGFDFERYADAGGE